MNKRINDLAEQAGLRVESWMTNPPKPFQILGSIEEFDKFTHLLIEDCKKAFWSEDCFVSDLAIDDYNKQVEKIRKRYED